VGWASGLPSGAWVAVTGYPATTHSPNGYPLDRVARVNVRILLFTGEDRMPVVLDGVRFAELNGDLHTCKTRVERVLSRKFSRPRDCSNYCFDVLVSTSRLYLDSLIVGRELRDSSTHGNEPINPPAQSKRRRCSDAELTFRKKFSRKVESLACWKAFQPINTFVDENQLRTQADCLSNLTLHLPEIYG
jgi:hypothetical protein